MTFYADAVLVQLVLGKQIPTNLLVQFFNIALLCTDLLVLSVVKLECFLELQLQEGVLPDVWLSDAVLARFIVEWDLTGVKLVWDTSVDLTIESLTRLRWSELTWIDDASRRVEPSDDILVNTTLRQATLEQLLYHFLQVGVVSHELVELVLIEIAATRRLPTERASSSKACHLLLHLPLNLLKTGVLQEFKLSLESFVLLLQLIEVGSLVRISLEQIDDISVNWLKLLIVKVLIAQCGVCFVRLVKHGLNLDLVLNVGALLFKFVVVVLKHLDQLFKVFNSLLVVQLDRF